MSLPPISMEGRSKSPASCTVASNMPPTKLLLFNIYQRGGGGSIQHTVIRCSSTSTFLIPTKKKKEKKKRVSFNFVHVWAFAGREDSFYKHAIIFEHLHLMNAEVSCVLAEIMYCLSFSHHSTPYITLIKCKCVNIDCQDVQLKVPPSSWRWWRVARFGAWKKFNACLLWKSMTSHNLGGLLVINGRAFDGSERIKEPRLHLLPLCIFHVQTGIY